ncbi:hypothetical protein CRG98_041993 [Punica granatum]|uniref:Uncharacterized protein n=1 Tax=Punica granatum TaxID=22663 RepID=A0A2I0I1T9_PUNGR|nr:hypothetical protein CRG98_041993 [Punica granatum]
MSRLGGGKREQDIQAVQFLYKGNRIKGYQTPNQLKMKHHCEINAMFYQMGGGSGGSTPSHRRVQLRLGASGVDAATNGKLRLPSLSWWWCLLLPLPRSSSFFLPDLPWKAEKILWYASGDAKLSSADIQEGGVPVDEYLIVVLLLEVPPIIEQGGKERAGRFTGQRGLGGHKYLAPYIES